MLTFSYNKYILLIININNVSIINNHNNVPIININNIVSVMKRLNRRNYTKKKENLELSIINTEPRFEGDFRKKKKKEKNKYTFHESKNQFSRTIDKGFLLWISTKNINCDELKSRYYDSIRPHLVREIRMNQIEWSDWILNYVELTPLARRCKNGIFTQ